MLYFFLHQYEDKRLLYIGQSDASTTKVANGVRILHFELSAVVLVATSCCSMC